MNLLEKRINKVITLKKAQIAEENLIINFDSENLISFLHLDPFIWSVFDELSDFFWQFFNFDETSLIVSDNLLNS